MLNQADSLDLVFQALADPTRRTILRQLSRGRASVTQLAEPHDMSLPAVVQHLAVLSQSGLVTSRKVGRARHYRFEPKALRAAEDWLADRRAMWERHFDRLEDFLEQHEPPKRSRT